MTSIPRGDHIDWCKTRALQYVDAGESQKAFTSMVSDLRKHPDTENHAGIELGTLMLVSGNLSKPEEVRQFIEGVN